MATPILTTKLYLPPARPKRVSRPRLINRLNEGPPHTPGITLISAPAGFGKTTLVSEWLECIERPTAWLSLDERDNDLGRFLTYLVAALQTIVPHMGAGILDLLHTSSLEPSSVESILTAVVNEITQLSDDAATPPTAAGQGFVFVLDDYHVINAKSVDMALTFLLEHMPPQMHLVIATREDPSLPLARLRARGQLTELRAADLRFTAAEAAEFLNQVMGFSLAPEEIAALETRTEGWIAGLQLAALSMQRRPDIGGFIRAFAGDHRYIVDYLIEEVLERLPDPVRNFLLQTAILEQLNGSLCDAVTGQQGSKAQLEALQRGNFFLIPLDDKRHWYRYHHLFADVLRVHLIAEQPDQVPTLHRRASEWYEQNGSAAEAIRHALAAKDFGRAADLVELAGPEMRRTRQESTLLGWLKALPDELIHCRPVLSIEYVGALLACGEFEGTEAWLRNAEQWLDTTAESQQGRGMIVKDEGAFRRLPSSIAMYRAGLALSGGNVPDTVTYASQVLDLALDDDYVSRGAAAALLGLAFWTQGDIEGAYQIYADGMASLQKAGNIADTVNGAITLATIRITQGRLREAMNIYKRGLQLATEQGGAALAVRGAVDLYIGMSELHYEHNDLHTATHLLLKSKELGEFNGLRQNRYRWRVAMARILQAQGDLVGALDLLHEAERMYMSDFSPNVRPITALKTRVWIAQGNWGAALSWAREQGLSAEDDLSYLREFEHITLARILLAHYKSNHKDSSIQLAIGLLARLLKAAEAGGRIGSVIELLVLQALTHQIQEDIPAAHTSLEQALTLAEPEGYVRLFLNEGADMAQLLRQAAVRRIMPDYTGKLLAAFEAEQQQSAAEFPPATSPTSEPLIEPLSQRELEILRLFKTELSGPEIARELVVALSTVRTHTKSIYSKLNVNNRRAAVKRAEELNLI